jgi:hypothetical protein
MKKIFIFFAAALLLSACSNNSNEIKSLQTKVDSLQTKLNNTYSAGFGEMMTNIQIHHAKLWFAGKNENWDLANYEIAEIKETFADIEQFQKSRPESEMVPMIEPAIDSVTQAVAGKSPKMFASSFKLLTSTCNDCHLATDHSYNVITIPQTPPFTNQNFKGE